MCSFSDASQMDFKTSLNKDEFQETERQSINYCGGNGLNFRMSSADKITPLAGSINV